MNRRPIPGTCRTRLPRLLMMFTRRIIPQRHLIIPRTVYRFNWTDSLWLLYLKFVVYTFVSNQAFVWFQTDPLPTTFIEGTTISVFLTLGLFAVCIALFGSGFVPKIYAAVTAVVGGFLSLVLGSWFFQAMLTLCFLWFFIDQFILHVVDARGTIPRSRSPSSKQLERRYAIGGGSGCGNLLECNTRSCPCASYSCSRSISVIPSGIPLDIRMLRGR